MSRPYIELYLNGRLLNFKEPPQVFMTYQHYDTHNPTAVKNSFSKTIEVNGTKENNKVFDCFYDNGHRNGTFNPNKRVPFVLMRNGERMEEGYAKLYKVVKTGNELKYSITLYGGIGEFLYQLSKKEDGTTMTLADLDYDRNDLRVEVNASNVSSAWANLESDDEGVWDFWNFAPCYNGVPQEDFDADKVAVYAENLPNFTTTKGDYKAVNGWVMGELSDEVEEWYSKDLRAYLQRPIIRWKEVFNACVRKGEESGWKVDLDADFFNGQNEYWEKSWMTLPLLSKSATESNIAIEEDMGHYVIQLAEDGKVYDLTMAVSDKVDVEYLYIEPNSALPKQGFQGKTTYKRKKVAVSAVYYQLVVNDVDGNEKMRSNIVAFTGKKLGDKAYGNGDYAVNEIVCTYVPNGDGNPCYCSEVGELKLRGYIYSAGDTITLERKFTYGGDWDGTGYIEGGLWMTGAYGETKVGKQYKATYTSTLTLTDATEGRAWVLDRDLLKSSNSPYDYFISYLKMFNLHIFQDPFEKLLHITTRNNFFTGDRVDMNEWIDRGNEMTITPVVSESKFISFSNDYDDTLLIEDYNKVSSRGYGEKRVDTGYEFNTDTTEITPSLVFKTAIQEREKGSTYRNWFDDSFSTGYSYPNVFIDGITTYLFNDDGESTEGDVISPKYGNKYNDWCEWTGYDSMSKVCFKDKDGKGVEGANVLLFYDGDVQMVDKEGESLNIRLTDDIKEFEELNEGKAMWIYSLTPYTTGGTRISIPVNNLPHFSRWYMNGNNVVSSMDFGTPAMVYDITAQIDDSSSIYAKYWESYIGDMYSDETRIVECRALLKDRVLGDWLRRFYWFDGSWWLMNKITDYDVTSNECTKVELIRINDLKNYTEN